MTAAAMSGVKVIKVEAVGQDKKPPDGKGNNTQMREKKERRKKNHKTKRAHQKVCLLVQW